MLSASAANFPTDHTSYLEVLVIIFLNQYARWRFEGET